MEFGIKMSLFLMCKYVNRPENIVNMALIYVNQKESID